MMNHDKKLSFVANMTAQALDHVAKTPNIAAPDGKMSHDKKLAFVTAMAKHGLQHFDGGGIAGGLSKVLGTNNGFQAQSANLIPGTNTQQLDDSYKAAQGAIGQQQGVANTLTPGISQGAGSENTLTNMLTNQANGVGPNPAQAALNENTGRNIQQQAALAAGQRGAGANAGLIATQAAQQGANTQQQAVGQSATLQAEQQLGAENNLQNLAANQIAQGSSAVQGVNNAQQNEQNIIQNANTAFNNAQVAQESNLNNVNSNTAIANQNTNAGILGGLFKGAGAAIGAFEKGGMVKNPIVMAAGGIAPAPTSGPQSYAGQWLSSSGSPQGPQLDSTPLIKSNVNFDITNPSSKKDKAPAVVSIDQNSPLGAQAPGGSDIYTTPDYAANAINLHGSQSYADPNFAADLMNQPTAMAAPAVMKDGGKVVARNSKEKAKVSGDSLKNDRIPAMLSEDEGVIDRDTMKDPGPVGQMARAVMMHVQKKSGKKK